MSNTSPSSRGQPPQTPRRPSNSSDRRPSTSTGIEPISTFLRDALREKKGLPARARSTTPRRVRQNQRPPTTKDEWLQSSGDEGSKIDRNIPQRPARPRRASDITVSKSSSTPPVTRGLGSREADARIDRLEKESWDLKHRVMLYQERAKRMNEELDLKEKEIQRLQTLDHDNSKLEDELALLKQQLEASEQEKTQLQDDNTELTQINEELVQQLEQRVTELESLEKDTIGRQNAIEEAAGIIQTLEQRLIEADKVLRKSKVSSTPPQTDSDYFSGDVKPVPVVRKTSPALSNPPQLAPDSDYFSADTSPLITPRSMKLGPVLTKSSPHQLFSAKETSAAFNREMGLRSIPSKDSMLSMYLETPDLPQQSLAASGVNRLRSLRKRNETTKATPKATPKSTPDSAKPKRVPQAWSDTRPLRNLYMTGELGRQVNSSKKAPPVPRGCSSSPETSPYSSSPEGDKYVEQKARSNPTIPVSQPEANSRPDTTASRESAQHVRSNSMNTRPTIPLVRHHSTPAKTSPRSSRAYAPRVSPTPSHQSQQPPTNRRSTSNTPPPSNFLSDILSSINKEPTSLKSSTAVPTVMTMPPTTYAAPAAQTAPTYSATKQTTQTHRSAPAPNPAFWPRRYPAWPPSAGLINRDLLFHGEGMEEMFAGDSPTREDEECRE
jgi:hypothetical protein